MKQSQRIEQYLKENPKYITGYYKEAADALGVHYNAVRSVARRLAGTKKHKIKVKVADKPLTGTPGGKFNAGALKSFVKDTITDYEVTRTVTGGVKKLAIISDLHGVFLCEKTFKCFLEVAKNNHFDEIVLNGDILDFPLLSRHTHKLINRGPMVNYSEIGEIEFVKKDILQKLRDATKANIVYRLGNHEERITSPFTLNQGQLARLAIVYSTYGTVKLEQMLELDKLGIEYDPTAVRSYYNLFDVLHGLSLAKNAPEQNIMMRMRSGSSGHSHRLQAKYFSKSDREYVWVESACMRMRFGVEYLPTAVTADWQTGFASVEFDLTSTIPKFYAEAHAIINGSTSFHGKIYRG